MSAPWPLLAALVLSTWTVSAHAATPSTCTVLFTGARASVTCTGPAGAVSVAPAPRGVAVSGKNVQLKDARCVAMPRTKAVAMHVTTKTGTAGVAMLRVCAAGPVVLVSRVSSVNVAPSTNAAVALSVVAAGDLTLRLAYRGNMQLACYESGYLGIYLIEPVHRAPAPEC
jgi:hypothetical protein